MILPAAVVAEYGRSQSAIMDRAVRDVSRIVDSLDWTGTVDDMMMNREVVAIEFGNSLMRNGEAAAANAAELFEAVNEAASGTFKAAEMAFDDLLDSVYSSVHYAAGSLFGEGGADVGAFKERLKSSMVRMVNQYAMDTMKANDAPGVQYARVANGGACPLCEELESRGYVWDVDELLEPHDGCRCVLVPGFGAEPEIQGLDELYGDIPF